MEKTRLTRRWTLAVAPLGTAVVFLSVMITAGAHDPAYILALRDFSVAIPMLSLIAFLTSLQETINLPRWWEELVYWILIGGYVLVAFGIGMLLSRVDDNSWTVFAGACLVALVLGGIALNRRGA